MAITKNYRVEHLANNLPTPTITDITDSIVTLDSMILQSTGVLSEAKLTLNAEFGAFISNNGGGSTPILSQFDRLRITTIGDDGVTEHGKIFEIVTDLSQLATRSSYFLPLELEGRERNLSGVPFGGFFRNASHLAMVELIGFAYEDQKGSFQPNLVLESDSTIPKFNPNIWDFTQVDNCYDALIAVLDSLNLPVSAGGGGNRYALIFEDDPLDTNNLIFKIIVQGTNNVSIPTLEQNDSHPITKIDKVKQASTGTIVVARGRAKTGTQPANYSQFVSKLEFYKNILPYDSTIVYPTDSYVVLGGTTYQANQSVPISTPPPSVEWTAVDVGDYIGTLQYSPFTVDKLAPIKNGFANPTGLFNPNDFDSIAIPDHNLVINDRSLTDDTIGTYRNWVTFRTRSIFQADLTPTQKSYMYNTGTGYGFYDGFQILIDPSLGTLEPPFDGNDPNGVPYANAVARFVATPNFAIVNSDGPTIGGGEWIVIRPVEQYDQCAVYAEGRVFEYNVDDYATGSKVYPGVDRRRGGTSIVYAWQDISGLFMGNDCFHTPTNIEQVDGLFGDSIENTEPLNDPAGIPYIQDSAIKITFGYDRAIETQSERDVWFKMIYAVLSGDALQNFLNSLVAGVYNTFATPNYTSMGWWFAWPTPYPFSTANPISEEVGQLYGGDQATLNRHRYFDLFNIQYTTTGKQGWTYSDSADLSEVTGVKFLFNFDIGVSGTRIPFTGDIPFAYWCIDVNGTRWKSKKVMYRHLGETQEIEIEFGDLAPVFPTRTPLGIQNLLENIIVPEIEVNEIFFKDKVVIQGFQCELPYDEYGRYSPNLWEQIIKPNFFDAFLGGTGAVTFEGTIDGFSFVKTPVAISAANVLSSQRTIIPDFEDFQNIVNVEQLQRFADSQAQIEQFPYEQYTVEQGGINDLDLEDSIYLHDPYLINETDDGPNTRLLAVREIHYSVPHSGGLIRKIVPVKVIDT